MSVKNLISAAIISLFMAPVLSFAQNTTDYVAPTYPYWKDKATQFSILPNAKNEIVFLGDSITDGGEWHELTGLPNAVNRGIGGDTAAGVLGRITEVTDGKPIKVFLMIGTNDLAQDRTPEQVCAKIGEVLDAIKLNSPKTVIYLQSTFPVIDGKNEKYKNENVNKLNPLIQKLAADKKVTWIDVASSLKDDKGQLKDNLTFDGLHLNGAGYLVWISVIKKYLKS